MRSFLSFIKDSLSINILYYDDYNIVLTNNTLKNDFQKNKVILEEERNNKKIIGTPTDNLKKEEVVLEGLVKDAKTGEVIIGATVLVTELNTGSITDLFGHYAINLLPGNYSILVKSIEYESESINLTIYSKGNVDFELYESTKELEEVIIYAEGKNSMVNDINVGKSNMSIETINGLPAMLGEPDVIRGIQLLPGISSVGEGASGVNVRGGNVGQNMILQDDALIFNSSHLFGFYSIFNPDIVKNVSIYKGTFPANYGGRVSSIIDVQLKEGNRKKLSGSGGIGFISSKLTIEGPYNNNKGSFIIGGRIANPNWIIRKINNIQLSNSSAGFKDLTGKIVQDLGKKNKLIYSIYQSSDEFQLASDTTYNWTTSTHTLKWKRLINEKYFLNTVIGRGNYNAKISDITGDNKFDLNTGINYNLAKIELNISPNIFHNIDVGLNLINFNILPGKFEADANNLFFNSFYPDRMNTIVGSGYISDEFQVNSKLDIKYGLRFSKYFQLGTGKSFNFLENSPRILENITDTTFYNKGEVMSSYQGFEPRFQLNYKINQNNSLKFGFTRAYQYLHLLSNSTSVTPIDFWTVSSNFIKPQKSNQYSFGFFNSLKETFEFSLELYYNIVQNTYDFKNGQKVLLNPAIETAIVQGKAVNYGSELLIRKNKGKLSGWLGYTYARSTRQIEGFYEDEIINDGKFFPSNFDKPHEVSLVTNYSFTRRIKMAFNFVYNTGRPISVPIAKYSQQNVPIISAFSERNQFRIPDYHRLDFSITIDKSHKLKKKISGNWTFSIYNLYSRNNAYSIIFSKTGEPIKFSVIGTALPSISYNFKF